MLSSVKTALSLSLLSLLASPASAVSWYFLVYYPASGAYFTEFSGKMVVPELPEAATYYLWPGLQPTDSSGVYQNVLDGRSGTWWFGSGWCCSNPTLSWGSGFSTYKGDVNTFSNVRTDDTNWTTTIVHGSTGTTDVNTFALSDKDFNQALFAIELYDVSWNFGALTFEDVTIKAEGSTDSSWCTSDPTNYDSATVYSITGAKASVSGTTVTCTIESVVLESPA
ncbi:hypothetical protein VP1G_04415 [Cytospora mali]|uniref:Uncharacterized protein n=1 Tax=Cytospora mali TaxID=578113 RepID=A0A194UZP6_CYTMA|nr:hypothetical protein VP1G_04415 [Valsa mali var. pyri (nom. inval.)]